LEDRHLIALIGKVRLSLFSLRFANQMKQ
jgi:hypothetical protein